MTRRKEATRTSRYCRVGDHNLHSYVRVVVHDSIERRTTILRDEFIQVQDDTAFIYNYDKEKFRRDSSDGHVNKGRLEKQEVEDVNDERLHMKDFAKLQAASDKNMDQGTR